MGVHAIPVIARITVIAHATDDGNADITDNGSPTAP